MPTSYSRRDFLRMGAATLAGSAAGLAPEPQARAMSLGGKGLQGPSVAVKSYCPFCQVRCTYKILVRDGKAESLVGEMGNRWTAGSMCPKGMSIVELVGSPHRITSPLLKTPDGGWRPIPYAEAIELVVSKIKETQTKHGAKAGDRIALTAPLWDCRESELAALMTLRFAGSVHAMPAGEVCISSASNMLKLMTGVNTSTTTVNEICNSKTLILWGANLNELYPPYVRWLETARAQGVRIVYLDPRKTRTSLWCDWQLQPLPGTDGALAIGAIRSILENKSYDEALTATLIPELELLRQDVAGYTPEKVAGLTGLTIQELKDFYATIEQSERTIVWMGGSLSRYTNGIQSLRAIMLMQGLRDNLVGPGKGLLTMEGGKPEGEKEFVDHICGANEAPRMNFRRLLSNLKKGDIDVLFLNSSYRRYPDCNGVREAMKKAGFVVHRGFFMTEEAEVAHLIVPATFSPESQGSHFGAEKQVVWRDKALDAPGACVPDWMFYRDIGRKLVGDKYPAFEQPEELYRQFISIVPSWKGMTLERLRQAEGGLVWPLYQENDQERLGTSFVEGKLLTPDGTMPVNDSLFGRIAWDHPKGSPRGADKNKAYPLVFMQGKVLSHWQQTLTNFSEALAQFSNGRYVNIHPATAAEFGLKHGDRALIQTATGSVEARVELLDTIIPGVIFTPSHLSRSSPFPQNRSEHINTITPNYWDRISSQTNGVGCALKKI